MERRNYFDILPLEFDPAEKNARKIEKEIENWKQRTQDLLANETNEGRRKQLKEELALYEDMKLVLSSPKTRNPEAKAYKDEKIRQLETLIEIMTQGQSGREVTNGQIRNVATKLRLQTETVRSTYEAKGFTVQKAAAGNLLANAFMKENQFRNISGHIHAMQAVHEARYPWFQKTGDLYDLSCYYCGGQENDCKDYHRKRTAELLDVMQKGSAQYASDMSSSGHVLADLFADGMTQVFDSEENRKKYDHSLERSELADFFKLLKSAPEEFKRDRQFVESCLRTIQKHFSDYNLALALYNQEAGLAADPFEPLEALIHVTCAACRTPAEFRTREEAQRAKCPACGASLYVKCPKCGQMAPANADRCSCGFAISEMRFFEDYKKAALLAVKNMDLAEAKKQLQNALNAYPGHPDLKSLEEKVNQTVKQFEAPLNELKKFMGSGLYSQAQKFLEKVSASMPQLNLNEQRRVIRDKLETAKKLMPPSADKSTDAGNRCVAVLDQVKDYQPAIDQLRMIPPQTPRELRASAVGNRYILSWKMAGDRGVVYQIVRKKEGLPQSHTDGEILAKDLNVLEYTDNGGQAGVSYGYAVYAVRMGAFSAPAICEIVNYADLDEKQLQIDAQEGEIRFRWVPPQNAVGVRILKCANSLPPQNPGGGCRVVAERALGSFTDTDVETLKTYGYRLQAVYPHGTSFCYSAGITKLATPQPKPQAVKNVAFKTDKIQVTATWTSPDSVERDVEIREVHSESARDLIGQVLPVTQLNAALGTGKSFVHGSSRLGRLQFTIPANSSCLVAVIVTAGSNGIISDIQAVSSVEMCEIDRKKTRVEGNILKIQLKDLPKNLNIIHYLMAKKTGTTPPWATEEDAKAHSMIRLPQEDYVRDGMIVIRNVPEEDLYVTVIGEYRMPNGQVVFSAPSKHRVPNTPKVKIRYGMSWGKAGLFGGHPVARNAKLVVECSAKEIPALTLVYRTDGFVPMSVREPMIMEICSVPETDSGYPSGRMQVSIPDAAWNPVEPGSHLRLMFTDEEEQLSYDLEMENLELLKVPAKK